MAHLRRIICATTRMNNLLRLLIVIFCSGLIAAMAAGYESHSRPGAMTWGPGTDFWAAAIAISHGKYGLEGGLGYRAISLELAKHLTPTGSEFAGDPETRKNVQDPRRVEAAFAAATNLPPDYDLKKSGYVTTWAEDIGYSDFYDIAFRLFGYHALSTYKLYFLVLATSFILFAAAFWRENAAMATLGLAVACLFLTSTAGVFSFTVPSPAANRYLTTLSMIPSLHLLLEGVNRRRLTGSTIGFLLCQAALYALVLSFRVSAVWTSIASLVLLAIVASQRYGLADLLSKFSFRHVYDRSVARGCTKPLALAALIIVASFGYPLARNSQLDPVYSNDAMPHHFVWHSAMLALTLNPRWPSEKPYSNLPDALNDNIGWLTYRHYMAKHHPKEPLTSPKVMNLYPAKTYDRIIRHEFLTFALKHPWYMVQLEGYYKPLRIWDTIHQVIAQTPPLAVIICFPMFVVIWLLWLPNMSLRSTAIGAVTIWACSLLPSMWAYAAPHVIAGATWSTFALTLTLGLCGLIAAWRATRRAKGDDALERDVAHATEGEATPSA